MSLISKFELLNSNKTLTKVEASLDGGSTFGVIYDAAASDNTYVNVNAAASSYTMTIPGDDTETVYYFPFTSSLGTNYWITVAEPTHFLNVLPDGKNGIKFNLTESGLEEARKRGYQVPIWIEVRPTDTSTDLIINYSLNFTVDVLFTSDEYEAVLQDPATLQDIDSYTFEIPDENGSYGTQVRFLIRMRYSDGTTTSVEAGYVGIGPWSAAGTYETSVRVTYGGNTWDLPLTVTVTVAEQEEEEVVYRLVPANNLGEEYSGKWIIEYSDIWEDINQDISFSVGWDLYANDKIVASGVDSVGAFSCPTYESTITVEDTLYATYNGETYSTGLLIYLTNNYIDPRLTVYYGSDSVTTTKSNPYGEALKIDDVYSGGHMYSQSFSGTYDYVSNDYSIYGESWSVSTSIDNFPVLEGCSEHQTIGEVSCNGLSISIIADCYDY